MEREELIRAIGEPMRLRILELLTRRQYCVRSLARMLASANRRCPSTCG